MDLGSYESVTNALKLYVAGEEVKRDSISHNIDMLGKLLSSLDTRVDKQKFLEANTVFVMPKRKFDLAEVSTL
jgi:SLIT-ROBO Rho GTPase activating protein